MLCSENELALNIDDTLGCFLRLSAPQLSHCHESFCACSTEAWLAQAFDWWCMIRAICMLHWETLVSAGIDVNFLQDILRASKALNRPDSCSTLLQVVIGPGTQIQPYGVVTPATELQDGQELTPHAKASTKPGLSAAKGLAVAFENVISGPELNNYNHTTLQVCFVVKVHWLFHTVFVSATSDLSSHIGDMET